MTGPQSKDEQAMRPCPKCGAPVHPENTGFHVCTLTSNPMVQRLRDIYPTHPLIMEAAAAIEELKQANFELNASLMKEAVNFDEANEAIADVRETLAAFQSEDVRIMAKRAVEEIGLLRAALQQISDGPPGAMENSSVAAWAAWIAGHALMGRVAAPESRDG